MNTTTKWIFFGLLGTLALGVSAWSFAGPGTFQGQTPMMGSMMAYGPMMGSEHMDSEHAGQRWEQMWQHMRGQAQATVGTVGPTSNVETSSPSSAQTAEQGPQVDIADFSFVPLRLTVKLGEAVRWTNQDNVQHNVVFDDGGLSSPLLSQGQSWAHTFTQEGTYSYDCGPHPFMKGTIVVER